MRRMSKSKKPSLTETLMAAGAAVATQVAGVRQVGGYLGQIWVVFF